MIIIITLASGFYKKERSRNNNNNHIYAIAVNPEPATPVADPGSEEAEQTTEKETEDLIAIHCPRQCISTALIFINQLILINKDNIVTNLDLETIFLPEAAAAYKDAICNFIQAIS